MKTLKTLAMASAAALTLGATAIATLSPADAQAYRGAPVLHGPLGVTAVPMEEASTNFGYRNWPYGDGTYRGVFNAPGYYGYYGYDRNGY
ncbi:hypothetical protein [Methyloferula stellata]|jgi:hypothetical protein|uniref:hypothetical protein n=1 Tax=Methyloferula stellata TaxID=876270 RepID=UPI0003A407CB|nr:hypothetical protein [Methyloferula stellata]